MSHHLHLEMNPNLPPSLEYTQSRHKMLVLSELTFHPQSGQFHLGKTGSILLLSLPYHQTFYPHEFLLPFEFGFESLLLHQQYQ